MNTKCPQCGNSQQVPDEYVSRAIKCTSCKSEFVPAEPHKPARSLPIRPMMKGAVGLSGTIIWSVLKVIGAMIMAAVTLIVLGFTLAGMAGVNDNGFAAIQFLLGIIALCQIAQFVKNIL